MRGITYYRWALAAPILLPAAALATAGLLRWLRWPGTESLVPMFAVAAVGTLFAALPWLLASAVALWNLRRGTLAQHLRVLWWLPIPYALVLGAALLGRALTDPAAAPSPTLRTAMIWGAAGLAAGYGYVLALRAGERALRRRGWLADPPCAGRRR